MEKIFYKLACILTCFNAGYQHLSEIGSDIRPSYILIKVTGSPFGINKAEFLEAEALYYILKMSFHLFFK